MVYTIRSRYSSHGNPKRAGFFGFLVSLGWRYLDSHAIYWAEETSSELDTS